MFWFSVFKRPQHADTAAWGTKCSSLSKSKDIQIVVKKAIIGRKIIKFTHYRIISYILCIKKR